VAVPISDHPEEFDFFNQVKLDDLVGKSLLKKIKSIKAPSVVFKEEL